MKRSAIPVAAAALTALLLGSHLATKATSQVSKGRPEPAFCCDLDASYAMGRVIDCDAGPVELRNAGGLAVEGDLIAEGELDVGIPATQNGRIDFYSSDAGASVLRIHDVNNGGTIRYFDDSGAFLGTLEADGSSGGGGYLLLNRDDSNHLGFLVDGNHLGNEGPWVAIAGSSELIAFNATETGDAAVLFPDDAINADETADEAGCASAVEATPGLLGGSLTTIVSRSITVPADGYVQVLGSCGASAGHSNGTLTSAMFGVTDTAGTLPSNQDVLFSVDASHPTGPFDVPLTVHGLFSVAAGTHTFYLVGRTTSGAVAYSNAQITLLYVPSAYGTVVSTLSLPPGPHGLSDTAEAAEIVDGLSRADLAAEREQEHQRHRAAVETRLQAMEERHVEQQRRIEQMMQEGAR